MNDREAFLLVKLMNDMTSLGIPQNFFWLLLTFLLVSIPMCGSIYLQKTPGKLWSGVCPGRWWGGEQVWWIADSHGYIWLPV